MEKNDVKTADSKFRDKAMLTSGEGVGLQEFIDSLPVATVVLDEKGLVQTVNEQARSLLNKDLFFFKGRAPGVVFECDYAHLPGGCGGTVHCSGCAIRIAITETFTTGNPVFRMGATLKALKAGDPADIHLTISTRKRGDVVLLTMEKTDSAEA